MVRTQCWIMVLLFLLTKLSAMTPVRWYIYKTFLGLTSSGNTMTNWGRKGGRERGRREGEREEGTEGRRKEYTNLSNADCFALDLCSKIKNLFYCAGLTTFPTKKPLFIILIHILLFLSPFVASVKYIFLNIFKEATISNILMLVALIFLTLISSCPNASEMEITKKLLIIDDFLLLMGSTNFILYFWGLVFSSVIYTCQHIWVLQTKRAKEDRYASYKVK